jgi:DNA polymerase-3 subunit alpha
VRFARKWVAVTTVTIVNLETHALGVNMIRARRTTAMVNAVRIREVITMIQQLWNNSQPIPKLTFTDLHVHSEYSLQDGMIRIVDADDPKHVKSEIILNADMRGTGAVAITDHGNMYGHAIAASACKNFGLKHIPGCEFYMATDSRFDKKYSKRSDAYMHINAWAKNKEGYANMCRMEKSSYVDGFYYVPRIDKELLQKHHEGIMWSDACVGGTICSHILNGDIDKAHSEFMWYLDLLKDDFYIEYHNHHMEIEDNANKIKCEWANEHGVPIIACTDAHFYKKEDEQAHETMLCIQYGNWFDNPAFGGFPGDGYWLLNNIELIDRYPVEYLNNTQLVVDRVEPGIIEFGEVRPPKFKVPQWFIDKVSAR